MMLRRHATPLSFAIRHALIRQLFAHATLMMFVYAYRDTPTTPATPYY